MTKTTSSEAQKIMKWTIGQRFLQTRCLVVIKEKKRENKALKQNHETLKKLITDRQEVDKACHGNLH